MDTKERMVEAIAGIESEVILRSDLSGFGSERSVTRLINQLIAAGVIVRIGMGIYAKAKFSRFSEKPVPRVSFSDLGWEALKRLGVDVKLGKAIQQYNSGKSTQVPVRIIFNTGKQRITRKISWGLQQIYYENDIDG